MLETCWLWFVISKEYVELTRPKIESRDPIFFTGTQSRSRVSGNDRLFPRGSEFGPNLEIPAGPAIQLRPRPDKAVFSYARHATHGMRQRQRHYSLRTYFFICVQFDVSSNKSPVACRPRHLESLHVVIGGVTFSKSRDIVTFALNRGL